jgi:hypothetical protein
MMRAGPLCICCSGQQLQRAAQAMVLTLGDMWLGNLKMSKMEICACDLINETKNIRKQEAATPSGNVLFKAKLRLGLDGTMEAY